MTYVEGARHARLSKDSSVEMSLSFYLNLGSRDQTPDLWLGSKCLVPLSHRITPAVIVPKYTTPWHLVHSHCTAVRSIKNQNSKKKKKRTKIVLLALARASTSQ